MDDFKLNINVDVKENVNGLIDEFKIQLIHYNFAHFKYSTSIGEWAFTDMKNPLRKKQSVKIIEDCQLNYLTLMFMKDNLAGLENFFIQHIYMLILVDLNEHKHGIRSNLLIQILKDKLPFAQQLSIYRNEEDEPFMIEVQ